MLVKLPMYFLVMAFPSIKSSLARDAGKTRGILFRDRLPFNSKQPGQRCWLQTRGNLYSLVVDFPSVTGRLARDAGTTRGILSRG